MENQIKDAKRQLLKGELAGFEFSDEMKKRVLEEIRSENMKVSFFKRNTKRAFPMTLSAAFVALFFFGMYHFILQNQPEETNANDNKVPVEESKEIKTTNEEDSTIPQVENEKETPESETTREQDEVKETETIEEETEVKDPIGEETSYFDEEFLSLAKEGFIKGIPPKVGTTVGEIKKQYGEPLQYGAGEGSHILVYEEVFFSYDPKLSFEERMSVSDEVETTAVALKIKEKLYLNDMKKGLGEPSSEGISDMDGSYYVRYDFENYTLWAETESDEKGSFLYVELVKKFSN